MAVQLCSWHTNFNLRFDSTYSDIVGLIGSWNHHKARWFVRFMGRYTSFDGVHPPLPNVWISLDRYPNIGKNAQLF